MSLGIFVVLALHCKVRYGSFRRQANIVGPLKCQLVIQLFVGQHTGNHIVFHVILLPVVVSFLDNALLAICELREIDSRQYFGICAEKVGDITRGILRLKPPFQIRSAQELSPRNVKTPP